MPGKLDLTTKLKLIYRTRILFVGVLLLFVFGCQTVLFLPYRIFIQYFLAFLIFSEKIYSSFWYSNERVSSIIATKSYGGKAVPDLLVGLMARDRPRDMQLAAATSLTFLHRAGALSADDPRIIFKTLQCLVSI